jgi:hypothetical protein
VREAWMILEFKNSESEIGVKSNRTHQGMEKDKTRSMDRLLQTESVVENYLHINNVHLITYHQIVAEYMRFFLK